MHNFYNFSKPTSDYLGEVMKNLSSIQIPGNNLFVTRRLVNFRTKQKYCSVLKIVRDYNYSAKRIKGSIPNLNKSADDYIPTSYTTQTYHNFINTLNDSLLYYLVFFGITLHFKEDGWIIFNIQQTGKFAINLLHFIVFIIHAHWRENVYIIKNIIYYIMYYIHYIYYTLCIYIHTYIRTIIRNIQFQCKIILYIFNIT